MAFNYNPSPQGGSGAYGSVPGPIQIPDNIYSQVNQAIPGLKPAGAASAGVINSELVGQVNPEVQNLLQNKSAAMGVAGGVPGSQFSGNNFTQSLGLNADQMQQQGVGDYLKFLTGVGSTQTDPNLAVGVATQNALDAAAPNPAAAAGQNLSLFDKYLNAMKGPSGGTGFVPAGSGDPAGDMKSHNWDYLMYS
jgi:hypothetical protein